MLSGPKRARMFQRQNMGKFGKQEKESYIFTCPGCVSIIIHYSWPLNLTLSFLLSFFPSSAIA